MKNTVKDLIRSTVISIGMALAIFCIVGMIFDNLNGGTFTLADHRFTKMVIGSALVGIGLAYRRWSITATSSPCRSKF